MNDSSQPDVPGPRNQNNSHKSRFSVPANTCTLHMHTVHAASPHSDASPTTMLHNSFKKGTAASASTHKFSLSQMPLTPCRVLSPT